MPAGFVSSSELLDTRDREQVLAGLFLSRSPRLVCDVGASIGRVTAAYLRLFPEARIHAFEPHPDSHARLVAAFGGESRVHIERAAVTDAEGPIVLHANLMRATSSTFPRPAGGRRYFPAADGWDRDIEVRSMTLDAYCDRSGIEHIDILKLDVQGGELAALRGARRLLAEQRIAAIFAEVFFVPHYAGAPLFHTLWSHLEACGYTLFTLFPTRQGRNGQLRFGDAIFISPQMRADVVDQQAAEP